MEDLGDEDNLVNSLFEARHLWVWGVCGRKRARAEVCMLESSGVCLLTWDASEGRKTWKILETCTSKRGTGGQGGGGVKGSQRGTGGQRGGERLCSCQVQERWGVRAPVSFQLLGRKLQARPFQNLFKQVATQGGELSWSSRRVGELPRFLAEFNSKKVHSAPVYLFWSFQGPASFGAARC